MPSIWGYEIRLPWKSKSVAPPVVVDEHAEPAKIVNTVRSKQLVYNTSGRSTDFQESDYNLTDVAGAVDTESYFRVAVDKFVHEVWKNGWAFVGKEADAIAYVKRRFHQMAMVSDQPTSDLFDDMARQLVMYSNAFVEKRRNDEASGGRRWTRFDGKEMIPIAGLFVLDATSMEIARADNGKPLRYKQNIHSAASRQNPEWPPTDMCHIHYSRQRGLAFGTPFIVPTLDDIRALRNMEQNIEILVFQHAVPLYLYKIGSEERPLQEGEIEALESKIEEMPKHGVLIVSERHSVESIGAEGESIRAEGYLEYFKNRVLSGLRLGAVVVGEGNTANRSTASTINAIVQDVAHTFQKRLKIFIDLIIAEILAEGGFEWDVAQFDKLVEVFIPEIDLEKKIAKENNILELWTGNALTTAEMRRDIGRDPYSDEDWEDTYWKKIGEPKALIQALDEKYVTTGDNTGASLVGSAASSVSKSVKNKNAPSNQHGTRSAPKLNKDNILEVEDELGETVSSDYALLLAKMGYRGYLSKMTKIYSDLKQDVAVRVDSNKPSKQKMIAPTVKLAMSSMLDVTKIYVSNAFRDGAEDSGYRGLAEHLGMEMIKDETLSDVVRFAKDVQSVIDKVLDDENSSALSLISKLEAMEYRVDFMARTQLSKAYNQGFAKGSMSLNNNMVEVKKNTKEEDGCEIGSVVINLSDPEVAVALPPYHPNCTCVIQRGA